jgi:nucleoside-diphosphate-sugar epimerase
VVVPCLAEAGFRVIATGRHRFDSPAADRVVLGDPRDPQWVESAVCGTANGQPVDGIVHLAAIPSPGGHPDPEIFATNTQGAFTILDAAARLGVRVAAVASSFSAYGYPWAGRRWSPPYVPIDEAQPAIPIDSYGLSKTVVEQVCAYADRRWGLPVVAFRMPFVGRGDHLAAWLKRSAADPEAMAQELWAWIDTRDVGRAIIQALTVGLEGYHLLNIAAPDTTVEVPTRELIKRYHPTTQIIGEFPGCASVVDCHQARRVLGFEARYSWRDGSALVV